MDDLTPADKEWLDLAWKYFQQHAQQRITYLNYFVIFSTILTTGLVTTFQYNFNLPSLGIALGSIQIFLAFIFWKIDERNKFLTKNAENIIKAIEIQYDASGMKTYKLFSEEEEITKAIRKQDEGKFFLNKQMSHGELYKYLFIFFFLVGVLDVATSSVFTFNKNTVLSIEADQIDSLKNSALRQDSLVIKFRSENEILKNDSSTIILLREVKSLKTRMDSILAPHQPKTVLAHAKKKE